MDNKNEKIIEFGEYYSKGNDIMMLSIIGEVEGHDVLPNTSKTTKYEHILPKLAEVEDNDKIKGLIILVNTIGGDVECGLAISEMIAGLSKPTVTLVLGGSHSIGVPLAVSADYSYIVSTATMMIHPVRLSGTVIGTQATYDYFNLIQKRITGFVCSHSRIEEGDFERLMMNTQMLTKDVGTVLVGKQAVEAGLIDEVGGIAQAYKKLRSLISK